MRHLGWAAFCTLAACSAEQQNEVVAETRSEQDQAAPPSSVDPSSVGPSAAADVPEPARGGGCKAGEDTIFSCKTAANKRIAVCGVPGGTAEYRYGAGEPELIVAGGRFASVPYSGGGEAQIAFDNAGTRYVVFSRMVRTNFEAGEPNNAAINDGVVVLRKAEAPVLVECSDAEAVPIQYEVAARHMEQENELFTEETTRADP